jgi:CARDB
MRRVALTSLVACVFLALPGAFALGARTPKRADARARLTACKPSLYQASRSLTVDASMHSLQTGDRMQLRFELFRKPLGSTRFRKLAGPGLGTWNPATPGVDRFRFRKPIQNLPAASSYYVKVTYRWLDRQNAAYARTVRLTGVCFQPDLRPDLRVAGFGGTRRLGPGQFAYTVVLRNAGRTASRDFDAVLTVGGLPRPAVNVSGLAAGERRIVELTGPRCESGATTRVELDPDNRVDESNEANNSRSTTC